MNSEPPPSFSVGRKWSLSLNVLLAVAAVLALVAMVNYLAARHFARLPLSSLTQLELAPLTRQVIASVTNDVKVIIYFDKTEPLYQSVQALLKEYKFANSRIEIETVDYVRDPAAATLAKARYKLNQPVQKNLVIFECNGRSRLVYESELSDMDIQPLVSGESKEVRRTHFKGEVMFTSALLTVITPRSLKAYFLQGHGEHRPDSDEKLLGYSKFAGVLKENSVQYEVLTNLQGMAEVPADCHLLIVAGPVHPLLDDELNRIERYLNQGGRLLVLFNNYQTLNKQLGLEKTLANWGVDVGRNVVFDRPLTVTGQDLVVTYFTGHAISRPLYQSRIYLVYPRSIGKASSAGRNAEAVQVEVLATTSPEGRAATDIRKDGVYTAPDDFVGSVPLMVAVEKGNIRKVSADRGSTRIVVVGESIFLGNETIDKLANREFASHALNWLLARNELLVPVPPRPIKEYKVTISKAQLSAVRWILMLGMPGGVMLMGLAMWARRRK